MENHQTVTSSSQGARELYEQYSNRFMFVLGVLVAIFFGARGLIELMTLEPPLVWFRAIPALMTSAAMLPVILFSRTQKITGAWVGLAYIGIVLLLFINWIWLFHLERDVWQFFRLIPIMVVIGLGTRSLGLWIVSLVVTTAGALIMVWSFGWNLGQVMPVLAIGALLSAFCYYSYTPIFRQAINQLAELKFAASRLEKAQLSQKRFVANATHELRTPMTGVLGMHGLLEHTDLDSEQRRMLAIASSSANHMLAVVDDILLFAKMESGKFTLSSVECDLRTVTEQAWAGLEGMAAAKSLRYELELPPGEVAVITDPQRVEQILFNLLSNAVKYTQSGGVKLSMMAKPMAGVIHVTWRCQDTGRGIAADRLDDMFEAFEQMESKRSRTDQGTGLGLAIMRELVSMMDGSINVKSVVGEGSTFTVSLILKAVHARAPARHAEIIPEEAEPVAYHVLVGEDNDVIAMILEQMLGSLGWRVSIVKNGESVVEEATREGADYDVILMDIQMPVIDGIEATRLIRSRLASPPPIVALTANTLETDVKLYRDIGMAGVIPKPIQRDDLVATVNEAVGKAQAQV